MICPSCGLQIPDGSNFCSHCGNAISAQGRASDITANKGQSAASGETGENYYMAPPPDEQNEKVLWEDHPSMRTAIPGIVLWIVAGLAIIIPLQFITFPEGSIFSTVLNGAVQVIVLLIVLGMLLRYYIRLHSIRYKLSNQRIFVTHGILNKRTDEVELEKYKDIFVNQDFWDKIVGCGDIEIVTSDVTNPTIRVIDVGDPVGKKETIRAAARARKSMLGITRREEL